MIVDDSERFLAAAVDLLTRAGLEVVCTARTSREARAMADDLRPELVLVDIGLGAESGIELSHRLVDDHPDLRSRVVLTSTGNQEDYVDLIAASPAAGFLAKSGLSAQAIYDLIE
jgi:DNA-binding NarL/FixJ family response regulator